MNLRYSVLWFDDTPDFYESLDFDPLIEEIGSWGFTAQFKAVTSAEEFLRHKPFSNFDLIVVDFNLEQYGHGQDFIGEIRGHNVYTEVIFYSAAASSELWDAIREKQLEGIFVANRQSILQKIERVAYQSVKKILDLENMRGIVMSEVGAIDLILDSIIQQSMVNLKDHEREAIFKRFHEQALKQHDSGRTDLDKFIETPNIEVMLSLCDSNKRWANFCRVRKQHSKLKEMALGAYDSEVLKPRNFLAHGNPVPKADGGYEFHHRGASYEWNEGNSVSLRKTILEYKKIFISINEMLKEGH